MIKETTTVKKSVKVTRKTSDATGVKSSVAKRALTEAELGSEDRVGAILRNERLKKKLEIDDVAKKLCIRSGYLQAIESGNYNALPQMPYSAGFVSSYAKFLGLNHTRVTQLFREEIHVKPKDLKTFVTEDAPSEASAPVRNHVLLGLIAVLLLAGLWMLFSPSSKSSNDNKTQVEDTLARVDSSVSEVEYFSNDSTAESVVENETITTEKEQAESKNVPTIVVPQAEATDSSQIVVNDGNYVDDKSTEVGSKGVEVKITAGDVWVEVKDASKIYLSKVLKAGSSYHLPDAEGLLLSVGKHVGVEVYVNGKLTPVIRRDRKLRISVDDLLKANH